MAFDEFGGNFNLGFDPSFDMGGFEDFNFSDPFLPSFDFGNMDFTFPEFNLPALPDWMSLPDFGLGPDFNFDFSSPAFSFPELGVDLSLPMMTAPGADQLTGFNLGTTPTTFGMDQSFFDLGIPGGTTAADLGFAGGLPPEDLSFGGFTGLPSPAAAAPPPLVASNPTVPQAPSTSAAGAPPKSTQERLLESMLNNQKWAPALGLGQLGLGLGGALASALSPTPKRKLLPEEKAAMDAQTASITERDRLARESLAAQLANQEEQANLARERMGGEGEQFSQNIELQRARMAQEADQFRQQMEAQRRQPLLGTDTRFQTLLNQFVSDVQGNRPDSPIVQQWVQSLAGLQGAELDKNAQQEKDGVLERSNRLGTNPAAELAAIEDRLLQGKQQAYLDAQQIALAFLSGRLQPQAGVLQSILQTSVPVPVS